MNLDAKRLQDHWPKSQLNSWMCDDFDLGLVTVIVPAHQRESLLEWTIRSVGNQTYRPVELIVVDDGSTDETSMVARRTAAEFETPDSFRFRYILQGNLGAPTARNRGLIESRGEFIQFLDSDDLLHPERLNIGVTALRDHPECNASWCPRLRFTDGEEAQLLLSQVEDAAGTMRYRAANLLQPEFLAGNALHRRAAIKNAGPWCESLKRWQDFEYQFRVACSIGQYHAIESPLYLFRQHGGERINSQYSKKSGIQSGFESLATVEEFLAAINCRDPDISNGLSQMYVTIVDLAARLGTNADLLAAIRGAIRHRKEFMFRTRMWVFYLIARTIGRRGATFALSAYKKVWVSRH
jgi:glycosyltransferase involved in cell wall biosynthesis